MNTQNKTTNNTTKNTTKTYKNWTNLSERWENEVAAAKTWHYEDSLTYKLYSAMNEAFLCLNREGEISYYKDSSTANAVNDAYSIFTHRVLPNWGYKPTTDEEVEEAVNLYNKVFKDFDIQIEVSEDTEKDYISVNHISA